VNSGAERKRLEEADRGWVRWRQWGPYVAERSWGTVREDYSGEGLPWDFVPHDFARSRAYRWCEDGMAAVCDDAQTFCLGLALWNGNDPILKERPFGVGGHEGNHGEDAKDYWWYLDSTPTHSWMRWRYHYPQRAFPYQDLVSGSLRRERDEPEYELLDTGVFDDGRYWVVTADYAKAAPNDLLLRVRLGNRGPDDATLHVLPTLWFRNTWRWAAIGGVAAPPTITAKGSVLRARHPRLGLLTLCGDGAPEALACDNESNTERLFGVAGWSRYPADGINDHVVHGAPTVSPDGAGSKAALHYVVAVPAGGTGEIRVRLTRGEVEGDLGDGFRRVVDDRATDAAEFYAALTPAGTSADRAQILRQAFGGLLWGKQFCHLEVDRWLTGDPAAPAPERRFARNTAWRHLVSNDVISVPDKWEYPWFSAWDLAFNCVALAHVDPRFAKDQLSLLCRETYMHPTGQLPAYEWDFSAVNPPVHAWAALRVYETDGSRDVDFLRRMLHKLMLNYTWWVNRTDPAGLTVFDPDYAPATAREPGEPPASANSSVISQVLWTAVYTLHLLEMALTVAIHDQAYGDTAVTLFERFARIAALVHEAGYWDDERARFRERMHLPDGSTVQNPVASITDLAPLSAVASFDPAALNQVADFSSWIRWFSTERPELFARVVHAEPTTGHVLIGLLTPDQVRRALGTLLDPAEFLSPHGLRSLSARHEREPASIDLGDDARITVGYEPGHSTTGVFGGNSNWHGPVWMPVNYLIIDALRRYARYTADTLTVEYPYGAGRHVPLSAVADDLADRLIGLFEVDTQGRRPVHGDRPPPDPEWRDLLPFAEFFHAETGEGLGATHHTGWTALVAALIRTVGRGHDR
jgi:hypothetical protein